MTEPVLLDPSGYGARPAGRVALSVEVLAELRRSLSDDELGAVVRVRLPGGDRAVMLGPDVPQRQVGSVLHVTGYWDQHRGRGHVFRVVELRGIERPQETRAATAYLVANIPGLGRKRAARLVTTLGRDAIAQLVERPDVARPLFPGGTGEAIARALATWAAEQQRDTVAHLLTTRLTAAGVGYGVIRRIVRFFNSADAAAVVTLRHPYRLVEVPGVGWQTADAIAQRLGVAEDDPARLLAACQVTLADAPTQGHTGLPWRSLARRAARLLDRPADDASVVEAVHRLTAEGHAVAVEALVGIPELVVMEAELADRVAGVALAAAPLDAAQAAQVARTLAASGLAPAQRDAIGRCLDAGVSVLTGRPGAGKTTTIKTLVACAQALGWRVQIVAPTGKAASRAAAITAVPASTVHRLLGRTPMDAPAPLAVDLVVVDEASMCDVETAAWLLRAVEPARGTRVVWCGDVDQLPSVGYGQVLADLISSDVIPTARLTEVFRQGAASPIVRHAHRLLDGQPVSLTAEPGWRYRAVPGPVATADTLVLAEVQALLTEGRPATDVQVLVPMKHGPLGVEHLNRRLQALLNPRGAVGPHIGGGVRVRVGDRVVVTRNIYDLATPVYNGEQGTVVEVDRRGALRVGFGDRTVVLAGIHCWMVRLAWALTVHRSQGSEYPAVVLAYDHRAHAAMLDRRLLYTAITRAREHLTLVGTAEALAITATRAARATRHTTLAHHLATLLAPLSVRV